MDKTTEFNIASHFSSIEDPRINRCKRHELIDIFVITICAVICGADNWVAIEMFGKSKYEWFKTFLNLKNGIPSHDTFGNVFRALDSSKFEECFLSWVNSLAKSFDQDIIAIDGKTLRHSYSKEDSKKAIHMVSAWSSKNSLVLGQVKVNAKSNEITAIPKLLEVLDLTGCIVTIDAMGCQRAITEKIIDQEGNYTISLKGNQGTLHKDVKLFFEDSLSKNFEKESHQYYDVTEKDHGRIEIRKYWLVNNIEWMTQRNKWKGLNGIGMVESTRIIGEKSSKEIRYFITSLDKVNDFSSSVRCHWEVENKLHWSLDVAFREDECRIRKDNAAENFSIMRRIALNLLRREPAKLGIANKRLRAGWDQKYLLKILKN